MPIGGNVSWLKTAVSSVLSQSDASFQLVCVVDGGDLKVEEQLRREPEIRVIRTTSRLGPAGARNVGIRSSDSKYVALLDSDDVWPPFHLSQLTTFLDFHPEVAVVGCAAQIVDEHGKPLGVMGSRFGSVRRRLLIRNSLVNSSCVFRRDAGDVVGFYDPTVRVCEDYELWLRMAQVGDVVVLPTPDLIKYRRVQQGVSSERISRLSMTAVGESRKALAQSMGFPKVIPLILQRIWELYVDGKYMISRL